MLVQNIVQILKGFRFYSANVSKQTYFRPPKRYTCSFLLCPSLSLFPSSLLFLQVDNRPCSRLPSTCFPYATEAASFLRAVMLLKPGSFPTLPELKAVISIRGVREEIGSREEETVKEEVKGSVLSPTRTHTSIQL